MRVKVLIFLSPLLMFFASLFFSHNVLAQSVTCYPPVGCGFCTGTPEWSCCCCCDPAKVVWWVACCDGRDCEPHCGGGDGGPTPDTTPPKCGVEIEPSVTGDNLVDNPGFETGNLNGWSGGGGVQSDWKHSGVYAVKGSGYTVSQEINVNNGEIYKVRVWAKAAYYHQGEDECWGVAELRVDGSGSNQITRGKYSTSWTKFEGAFVAKDKKMTIELTGDRDGDDCWYDQVAFDDIWVKKIAGAESTPDQAVSVQIGLWDNRGIGQYRIRNKGVTDWDPWTDTSYSDAWDPINWTLSNNYEVEVQVRDGAENKSEICSDKIGYISPPGIIAGAVYDVTGLASACVAGGTQINPAASKIIGQAGTVSRTPIGQGSGGAVAINTGIGSYSMLNIEGGSYQLTANIAGYFGSQACYPDIGFAYVSIPPDKVVDIGLSQAQGSWFQTQDGNVHSQGSISSKIPATAAERYFSLNGSGGYPGVISFHGSSVDFGSGSASAPPAEWLAKTSSSKKSYNYFYQLLGSLSYASPPSPPENEILAPPEGITAYDVDIATPQDGWNVGTNKTVIITSGKFLIKGKIRIDTANGGSLVVIAQGGIGVSKNLPAPGTLNNRLQGVFITDGTFYTSVDEDFTFTPADSDKILVIDGGVIAQSVNLNRDFSGSLEYDNNTTPAETFRYDPSLFMNIHPDLWKSSFTWQELAP